jgi:antitoxin ParD1/3/4
MMMGMVKKSITVTDQQDTWIKAQIELGLYGNESEVVRELIRERQLREQELELVRAQLIKAEQGGFSSMTPDALLRDIKQGMGRDAVSNKP